MKTQRIRVYELRPVADIETDDPSMLPTIERDYRPLYIDDSQLYCHPNGGAIYAYSVDDWRDQAERS